MGNALQNSLICLQNRLILAKFCVLLFCPAAPASNCARASFFSFFERVLGLLAALWVVGGGLGSGFVLFRARGGLAVVVWRWLWCSAWWCWGVWRWLGFGGGLVGVAWWAWAGCGVRGGCVVGS